MIVYTSPKQLKASSINQYSAHYITPTGIWFVECEEEQNEKKNNTELRSLSVKLILFYSLRSVSVH